MSFLRRHSGYFILSLVWLIVLGCVFFVARRPQPAPLEILPPPPTATSCPTATPQPLQVYVSGAVLAPDVYELPADSRVEDAIEAAGGATDQADLEVVNLAQPLGDGAQVHVPRLEDHLPTPPPVSTAVPRAPLSSLTAATAPVDINTATAEELQALPGIGPALCQRIIEGRPYSSIEEITRVDGIGEATFEKLRECITVE